jgi:hypothetical protein
MRTAVINRLRRGATAVFLAAAVGFSPAVAWAAGNGGGHGGGDGHGGGSAADAGNRPDRENVRPRDEAHLVGGSYMQINPLWVPITKDNRARFQAITARLVPLPDRRVPACYTAPWAQEAILFALHEAPLTLSDVAALDSRRALKDRLLQRIHAHIGQTNYQDIILLSGLQEPDPAEMDLTFMCH